MEPLSSLIEAKKYECLFGSFFWRLLCKCEWLTIVSYGGRHHQHCASESYADYENGSAGTNADYEERTARADRRY